RTPILRSSTRTTLTYWKTAGSRCREPPLNWPAEETFTSSISVPPASATAASPLPHRNRSYSTLRRHSDGFEVRLLDAARQRRLCDQQYQAAHGLEPGLQRQACTDRRRDRVRIRACAGALPCQSWLGTAAGGHNLHRRAGGTDKEAQTDQRGPHWLLASRHGREDACDHRCLFGWPCGDQRAHGLVQG